MRPTDDDRYLPMEGWLDGFTPQYVPNTCSARLQRYVLRNAWLGVKRLQRSASVVKQTQSILWRYRRRLADAALGGVDFLKNYDIDPKHAKNLLRMANCLPTTLVPVPKQRRDPCRRRVFCPWCYSRWVREIWEKFDAVMYPEDKRAPGRYNLLPVASPKEGMVAGKHLRWWWDMTRHRMSWQPEPTVGRITWVRLSILRPDTITAQLKGICLTESTVPTPGKLFNPKRMEALKRFRQMLAYPRGLVYGPSPQLVEILNTTAGWRMYECYGILRKKNREKTNGKTDND